MAKIIASYSSLWKPLSEKHSELENELEGILDRFKKGEIEAEETLSYAIIGTFGAGKTQLLYYLAKKSIEKGLLPIFFRRAQDIFDKIIKDENKHWTQDEVNKVVNGIIEEIKSKPSDSGYMNEDKDLVEDIRKVMESGKIDPDKIVIIVDELEVVYRTLLNVVIADDKSPLREWLRNQKYLKFLAFAPASIYEMGGADDSSFEGKFVIPPVDMGYIRKNLIDDAGKANAAWWLSRGKPRHLYKAIEILKKIDNSNLDSYKVSQIVEHKLDSIGQETSKVPPALLENIDASLHRYVLDITPINSTKDKRFVIDTNNFDLDRIADRFSEICSLKKESSVSLAYYYREVSKVLSDGEGMLHINLTEIPELMHLAVDLTIEQEHYKKGLLDDFLKIYKTLGDEGGKAKILLMVHDQFKESITNKELPISVENIRKIFPFPIMSPIVKNHNPEDVKKRFEGDGLPIWSWKESNINHFFFASYRDFKSFSQKDDFQAKTLPNGNRTICLFPSEDSRENIEGELIKWLEKNNKLRIIYLPSLLSHFMISLAGELSDIPNDFDVISRDLIEDNEDVILSRKVRLHRGAIFNMIKKNIPIAHKFFDDTLPDVNTVWGTSQITDDEIVIPGISLAFLNINSVQKKMHANIRELIKSRRSGMGAGYLNFALSRGGYATIANDLLPRLGRKKGQWKESPTIEHLRNYLNDDEQNQLKQLAYSVPIDVFKILGGEDKEIIRFLEAFWRATKWDFDDSGFDSILLWLKEDLVSILDDVEEIQRDIGGIDFDQKKGNFIRSHDSLKKLLQYAESAKNGDTKENKITRTIIKIFLKNIKDSNSNTIRDLKNDVSVIKNSLSSLKTSQNDLIKNFEENKLTKNFVGITKEDVDDFLEGNKPRENLQIEDLKEDIKGCIEDVEGLSSSIHTLGERLRKIDENFRNIRGK